MRRSEAEPAAGPAAGPADGPDVAAAGGGGRRRVPAYVWRTWAVVVVFAAVTLWRSHVVGIGLRDPHLAIVGHRLPAAVGMFALLVAGHALWRTRHGEGPRVRRAVAAVRERWTPGRLGLAASALLAYHVTYFCYRNLKSWDVLNAPRDRMLLGWDRWLFAGHDPAALLHAALGEHVSAYVLIVVYESFSTVVAVSFVAAVALPRRMRETYAATLSGMLIWILGVASYYAIPSLGPFWSAPQLFSGLPDTIVTETQALFLEQRAQLLAHPELPSSVAQVSAFASLHVGVLTVLVLMARHLGLRLLTRLLAVDLALTLVATVYLGWHFAVDDVAGLAIGVLAVWLGTRIAGSPPARRRSRHHDSPAGTSDSATSTRLTTSMWSATSGTPPRK